MSLSKSRKHSLVVLLIALFIISLAGAWLAASIRTTTNDNLSGMGNNSVIEKTDYPNVTRTYAPGTGKQLAGLEQMGAADQGLKAFLDPEGRPYIPSPEEMAKVAPKSRQTPTVSKVGEIAGPGNGYWIQLDQPPVSYAEGHVDDDGQIHYSCQTQSGDVHEHAAAPIVDGTDKSHSDAGERSTR